MMDLFNLDNLIRNPESEIDKNLVVYREQSAESGARNKEIEKFKKIFARRDDPQAKTTRLTVWADF